MTQVTGDFGYPAFLMKCWEWPRDKVTTDPSIHICIDSSQTVTEHNKSFISSALVQETKNRVASYWGLNTGPPAYH